MRKLALGACIVGCLIPAAAASPLAYSETASGDLTSYPLPIVQFTLDVGANTVAGTQSYSNPTDFDSFGVLVPPGMRLTQIAYAFAVTGRNDGVVSARTGYWLKDQPIFPPDLLPPLAEQLVELLGPSPLTIFPLKVPLAAGPYYFLNYRLGSSGSPTHHRNWWSQYSWTLQVEPVPEPSSLLLLGGGGLVAVLRAVIRRR